MKGATDRLIAGSHGGSGVPPNIRKSLDGTRWRLVPIDAEVPVTDKCCKSKTFFSAEPFKNGPLIGTPTAEAVAVCVTGVLLLIVIAGLAPIGI